MKNICSQSFPWAKMSCSAEDSGLCHVSQYLFRFLILQFLTPWNNQITAIFSGGKKRFPDLSPKTQPQSKPSGAPKKFRTQKKSVFWLGLEAGVWTSRAVSVALKLPHHKIIKGHRISIKILNQYKSRLSIEDLLLYRLISSKVRLSL